MKKLLTSVILMVFAILAHANYDAKLVIKQKSGNETVLALSTNPIITFVGENMKIENEFINISIPIDDVDNYRTCHFHGHPKRNNGICVHTRRQNQKHTKGP